MLKAGFTFQERQKHKEIDYACFNSEEMITLWSKVKDFVQMFIDLISTSRSVNLSMWNQNVTAWEYIKISEYIIWNQNVLNNIWYEALGLKIWKQLEPANLADITDEES